MARYAMHTKNKRGRAISGVRGMELTELWALTDWVQKYVVGPNVSKLLGRLHGVLNQNAQPNQAKQSFESQMADLDRVLVAMPLGELTDAQRAFLRRLNIEPYLGAQGSERIRAILKDNALDVVAAASKIDSIKTQVSQGLERLNQLRAGLDGQVDVPEPLQGSVLLRVGFFGDASIDNVVDLKEWSAAWHDIARGITMAHGAPPEDFRIIGASRGSVVLDIALAVAIAKTTSYIIKEALEIAKRYLEIKMIAAQVDQLHLQNAQIVQQMHATAEEEKARRAELITQHTAELLRTNGDLDGEKRTALERSTKRLVEFLSKGGEVDFVAPDTRENGAPADETDQSLAALRTTFHEIRRLENEVRRLEKLDPPAPEA